MLRQASVCVIFVLVAGSHRSSAGAGGSYDARIIKYAFNDNGLGTYSFEYETSDGSYRREDGGLVAGRAGEALVVRGEFGYVDPEGRLRVVHYVADENGYRPQPESSDTRFNDRRIV